MTGLAPPPPLFADTRRCQCSRPLSWRPSRHWRRSSWSSRWGRVPLWRGTSGGLQAAAALMRLLLFVSRRTVAPGHTCTTTRTRMAWTAGGHYTSDRQGPVSTSQVGLGRLSLVCSWGRQVACAVRPDVHQLLQYQGHWGGRALPAHRHVQPQLPAQCRVSVQPPPCLPRP